MHSIKGRKIARKFGPSLRGTATAKVTKNHASCGSRIRLVRKKIPNRFVRAKRAGVRE
jgi:hypothetical protein